MHLTEQQIAAFQRLYKSKFGKDITTVEALEKGVLVVHLLAAALKENEKHVQKRITTGVVLKVNPKTYVKQ